MSMKYLFKGIIDRIVDKSIDKVMRYIITCVVRCSKHPFEHKKWCKEHPKSMELVNTICDKAIEARKGRAQRAHTQRKGEQSEPVQTPRSV